MGGQSSGYQSQPMNQGYGGQRFGGGGFGGGFGGYGNGGYMPQSFNQQGSSGYQSQPMNQGPQSLQGYGQQQSYQPQGFGWNNNFSNGFGGWNQFGGWPQFNGFQSGWQPQYQQPQSQQPINDMVPTRAQGMVRLPPINDMVNWGPGNVAGPGLGGGGQQMVRLPPINYDQYQKQPNQYEYLNGGNSPFSQVA